MKKVIVDTNFWEVFPEATIEILSVNGIDNHVTKESEETYHQLLNEAAKEARNYLTEETFSQNEVIAQWRQAFTTFKTKKGARTAVLGTGKPEPRHLWLAAGLPESDPAVPDRHPGLYRFVFRLVRYLVAERWLL